MVVKAGPISVLKYLDIDENEGASGIKGFRVRVSGGELFAHGSGSGYGIEGSNIFVTGGVAILTGDNNYSSYSLINDFKGCAYSGNISEIDAFVEISDDGKIYYPYGGGNNGLILRDFPKILRLTPKSNEYTRNTGDETNLFVIVSFVTIFSMCTLSVLKFRKKED